MGKPQPKPVMVDNDRTRTAADIVDLSECQALLRRHTRNVEQLLARGGDQPDAPRNIRTALHFRRLAIQQLTVRLNQLQA